MTSQAQPRAPPLEVDRRRPADPVDHAHNWRTLATRISLWAGAVWAGALFGTLRGLDRVPWPEALLWSLISGILVWRTIRAGAGRSFQRLLGPTTIELGVSQPQVFREALDAALVRRGYRRCSHRIHVDRYAPVWGVRVLPPLRIAWSGPGAVIEGPRWLVRLAARLAVG